MSDNSQLFVRNASTINVDRQTILIQSGTAADPNTKIPQITFDGMTPNPPRNQITASGLIELYGYSTLTIQNCQLIRPIVGLQGTTSNIRLHNQSNLTLQNMEATHLANAGVTSCIEVFNNSTVCLQNITYELGTFFMCDNSYFDSWLHGTVTTRSTICGIIVASQASADIANVTLQWSRGTLSVAADAPTGYQTRHRTCFSIGREDEKKAKVRKLFGFSFFTCSVEFSSKRPFISQRRLRCGI